MPSAPGAFLINRVFKDPASYTSASRVGMSSGGAAVEQCACRCKKGRDSCDRTTRLRLPTSDMRLKLRLAADLKTTDLRKLVLVQELKLLKEFEKRDVSLAAKLDSKHSEKAEIVSKVAECQDKLTQKKAEIERLLEKDKTIMAEFHAADVLASLPDIP